MNEFEKFLEENNYEDDLEFQLCDLEVAFNAGKELQWKPSEEQMKALYDSIPENVMEISEREMLLNELYKDLRKVYYDKL